MQYTDAFIFYFALIFFFKLFCQDFFQIKSLIVIEYFPLEAMFNLFILKFSTLNTNRNLIMIIFLEYLSIKTTFLEC